MSDDGGDPWDEANGPPPTTQRSRPPPPSDDPPAPPPAPTAFDFTRRGSAGSASVASGASGASSGPPASLFRATAAATGGGIRRTGSVSSASGAGSAFEDEDMANDNEEDVDAMTHDHIRQEALRMLEVADADKHYSVHRTITGGFSAQPKALGGDDMNRTKGTVRASLKNLNFTANRMNVGKRFTDLATSATSPTSREDLEYGEHNSVVDMEGLQSRSAANTTSTPSTAASTPSSAWSSRYSIDSTLFGMSGGSMRGNSNNNGNGNNDRIDREASERYAARNLFAHSPTGSSPGIFGSGFAFRKHFIYGQQGVNANLHSQGTDLPASRNPKLKTWQEQLLEKKRQQRRLLLLAVVFVVCLLAPATTVSVFKIKKHKSAQSAKSFPADGSNGSVTFYVTGDGPHNDQEKEALEMELAIASETSRFAVHLGNIQVADENGCVADHYVDVADTLEDSSPNVVFAIPGAEDWNNCPDPDDAWLNWQNNFELLDKRWDDVDAQQGEFEVYRQKHRLENWAFVEDGVLFLGVHVINGNVRDQHEFDNRNSHNYRWVMGMSQEHKAEIRAVVVFGNASPGQEQNKVFFAQAEDYWREEFDKPVLYVHASSGRGKTEQYKLYSDVDHVWAAQVDTPDDGHPLRINVGSGKKPFRIG